MDKSKFAEATKLVFIVLLFWCNTYAEDRAIEWRIDPGTGVAAEDRPAIIKLVKEIGIEDPARVSVVYVLPSGGQRLKVESQVTVDGMHRSWLELAVCRKDWKPFYCSTKRAHAKRFGRWQASKSDLTWREAWRIQDQSWHLDVFAEPNIPYTDVENIVLSIRRGQLVNRLPTRIGPLRLNPEIPDIQADEITRISRYKSELDTYEVSTSTGASGWVLRIKIVSDLVELQSVSSWIS